MLHGMRMASMALRKPAVKSADLHGVRFLYAWCSKVLLTSYKRCVAVPQDAVDTWWPCATGAVLPRTFMPLPV